MPNPRVGTTRQGRISSRPRYIFTFSPQVGAVEIDSHLRGDTTPHPRAQVNPVAGRLTTVGKSRRVAPGTLLSTCSCRAKCIRTWRGCWHSWWSPMYSRATAQTVERRILLGIHSIEHLLGAFSYGNLPRRHPWHTRPYWPRPRYSIRRRIA